jgi:hypothetical protein
MFCTVTSTSLRESNQLSTKEVMRKVDARDSNLKSLDLKLSRLHLAKSSWYSNFRSIWEKKFIR